MPSVEISRSPAEPGGPGPRHRPGPAHRAVLEQWARQPGERWGRRAVCRRWDQNERAAALRSRQAKSWRSGAP